MSKPELGAGDVQIKLNDGDSEIELTLKPSLKASIALSTGEGGLKRMSDRCLSVEFEAIRQVIIQGLGGKGSKDLPDLIYQTGIINLVNPCVEFINNVANGGRPLGDSDDEEGEETPLVKSS